MSHWEKRITGTFYLPWGYDAGMLFCTTFYGLLAIFPNGYEFVVENLYILLPICDLIAVSQLSSVILTAIVRIYHKFSQTHKNNNELILKVIFFSISLIIKLFQSKFLLSISLLKHSRGQRISSIVFPFSQFGIGSHQIILVRSIRQYSIGATHYFSHI